MNARTLLQLSCLVAVTALLSGCVLYEPVPGQPVQRQIPPPPPDAPRQPISVNVSFFYDSLDPDGDWLWIEPYGWVWAPNSVAPFWRPYTVGHWEWTDWGWTWVSSEPWGWATYHYGRWMRADRHGWVWVPGDVWGPAWVAWRDGPGVVGWAPLPPEVRFHVGVGLDWGGISIDVAIHPDHWCFVDDARFADPDVDRWAYPVGRNTSAIRGTRQAGRVRVDGERIVNEGIDRGELERRTHRTIPARRIVDNPRTDRRTAEVRTEEVRVFHPQVLPAPPDATPARGRRPADQPRPPEQAHTAEDKQVETGADRRWDRNWNKEWDKLEKLQRRDQPATPAPAQTPVPIRAAPARTPPPPSPMRPEVLEKVRTENMDAAENAYREQVAERERAKRQAERQPKKAAPKKDEKGGEKKQ